MQKTVFLNTSSKGKYNESSYISTHYSQRGCEKIVTLSWVEQCGDLYYYHQN